MSHLIIVAGPSGVGKNTLVDKLVVDLPHIRYLKKVTTRKIRPDDRDEEADFLSTMNYNLMLANKRIAWPYKIRGCNYGLPVDSIAELKESSRVCVLADYNLIRAVRDVFDTTTVFVTADQSDIIDRLIAREDDPDQKERSIESVPQYLEDYQRNKELFDYVIRNQDNLEIAQKNLVGIAEFETKIHNRKYSILIPNTDCSPGEAQWELNEEADGGMSYSSFLGYDDLALALDEIFSRTNISYPLDTWFHKNVLMTIRREEDSERQTVSSADIVLSGKISHIMETSRIIEEKWPHIVKGLYEHNKMFKSKYDCEIS